jgi:dihydroorotase
MNLPDIETVAAKVHDAWMHSKLKTGVTSRSSETGEELMVPYDKLSEAAKELDRASVRAVYAAIEEVTQEATTNSHDGVSAASGFRKK